MSASGQKRTSRHDFLCALQRVVFAAQFALDQCCRSRVFNKYGRRRTAAMLWFRTLQTIPITGENAPRKHALWPSKWLRCAPSHSCLVSRQATKRLPNGPSNVETNRVKRETMDPNETIIEIAGDRRRLKSIRDAVLDTQDLCARSRSTVQATQELLQQVEDLHQSNMGPVLRKSKYGV